MIEPMARVTYTSYGYLTSGGTLAFEGKKEDDKNYQFLSQMVQADKTRRNIDSTSKYTLPYDDYGVVFRYTDQTTYFHHNKPVSKDSIYCKKVQIQYKPYFYHSPDSDQYGLILYIHRINILT